MSGVRFILGAEADIASSGEVKDVGDSVVDRITGRLPSPNRGMRRRPTGSVSVSPAATGTFVIDLGTPGPGNMWRVSEIVVTGATDREAPAGAVSAIYCGSPARQLTSTTITDVPILGSLVRPGLALPSTHIFSGDPFPVHDSENLFVIIYSLTTAVTVMSATATATELNSTAISWNIDPS